MRVLDSYALVYSLAGAARYEDANGLRREVGPGDVILVFPDLPHMYGPPPGRRWSEFYLVFDGPVFDLWRSQGLLDPARPVFHCDPVDRWLPRLESVPDAPRVPSASLAEVCRLQQVLSAMLDASTAGGADAGTRKFLSRACALLESDLSRELDLPQVAQEVGTSYETFRKRFTAAMGTPPARWRAARILERACELMQRGALSDKQIADRLGFCDEFHFSRKFKAVIGVSPRHFRRSLSRSQRT
jgi:AraC-like DNA-binding protein